MPHFIWWWCLLGLPLAPAVACGIMKLASWRQKQLLGFWGSERLRYQFAIAEKNPWRWRVKTALTAVALSAAVVALARPSVQSSHLEFPEDSTEVIIVADVSRSMNAHDSGPPEAPESRLTTALKGSDQKIVPTCQGNSIGIVTFAGKASAQLQPTHTMKNVTYFLRTIQISDAPGDGSNINAAFEKAWDMFAETRRQAERRHHYVEHKRVIVFWSDGGSDQQVNLQKVIEGCNRRGLQVLIFGVGGTTPVNIPVPGLAKRDRILQAGDWYVVEGEVARTALDQDVLMTLQKGTAAFGSRYVRVRSVADVELQHMVSDVTMVTRLGERELFHLPIIVFIVFLSGAALVDRRWKNQQPGK